MLSIYVSFSLENKYFHFKKVPIFLKVLESCSIWILIQGHGEMEFGTYSSMFVISRYLLVNYFPFLFIIYNLAQNFLKNIEKFFLFSFLLKFIIFFPFNFTYFNFNCILNKLHVKQLKIPAYCLDNSCKIFFLFLKFVLPFLWLICIIFRK